MKVLKWEVPIDDDWHNIGAGSVLLVGSQRSESVTVWTIEQSFPARPRAARVFATGQPIPANVEHLGSVQAGPFVWHVFA